MKFGRKSHRLILIGLVLTVLTVVVVVTVSAGALLVAWERSRTLYPTPETDSTFLKSYTPLPVIERFRCCESSSFLGPHMSGAAGKEFVPHGGGFDAFFVMRSDKWTPLMAALDDDMYQQLGLNGAQILSRSGDTHSGFRYNYKLGKSIGSLTIAPLEVPSPSPVHRKCSLPNGEVDVRVHIEEREMWFPMEALPNPDQLAQLHAISTGTLTY
jgi:hypothetical protein